MEMTPIDDYSDFYSLFQELDSSPIDPTITKRLKIDEANEEFNTNKVSPFNEIMGTLLLLDEEEQLDNKNWQTETQVHTSFLQQNTHQKTQKTNNYRTHLQHHYSNINQLDQLRVKRARTEANIALTSAVTSDEAVSIAAGGVGPQQRRLWVKDRSKAWWDLCNSPDFPEDEFRKAFRMSKATFDMICEELDSAVTKKDTMLRLAIPVRQRVAVCIWRLATGEPLRLVSKRFGLGISTCHKLVLEVCGAIKNVLMPKYVQWPDSPKMEVMKNEFEGLCGIPNVCGAMYTTHIPIIAPKISVASYFNKKHTERNQKTSYTITVQGVVDTKGAFTDVSIGWPGSMSDDKVLEKSGLFQRASRGALKDVWVVGNAGHPLLDWALVPYTHSHLTWSQHTFNQKVEENQRVVKEAFMRLKARWTCLQKRTEVKLQELPAVLGACCVLHNICEMNNEGLDPELRFELFDDEMVAENSVRSFTSMKARDQIAHNLLHHHVGGSGTKFM